MKGKRRSATTDDARAGAYFTDGTTLYEVYDRREAVGKPKPGGGSPLRFDECLLGDALDPPERALWVPVDEVEGMDVVREPMAKARLTEAELHRELASMGRR